MKKNYLLFIALFMGQIFLFAANKIAPRQLHSSSYVDTSVESLNVASLDSFSSNVFQLFSHGKSGELLIDGQWKSAQQIAAWFFTNVNLAAVDQINIYGCEFAKGEKGLEAVRYLEKQLGKKIAASNNITGKGGDWILEIGESNNTLSFSLYAYSLQCANYGTGPSQDFDCDGIINSVDIDDDNDGVLDVIEMGTCTSLLSSLVDGSFEAAAPVAWNENTNTGSLNSTMGATGWASTNSPDTWTGGFSLVGSGTWAGAMNGVPATPDGNVFAAIYNGFINEAITKSIPASQGIQVGHTYTVEFYQIFGGVNGVTPVGRQAQLRFTFDGVAYLSNTMTYNGNNVKQWEKTSFTFTATTNAPVLAIDVVSTGDGNYIGIDGIVFYEQNTPGCGGVPIDTDGDGIPNHLDLDSDNDGCSDALEGGATTNVTPNYQFSGAVGANGLDNTLESGDNGIPNYTSTYNLYAVVTAINACTDTDGDGIKDVVDIDDDNDGIPDKVECPALFGNMATGGSFSVAAASIPNWYMGLASTALPITDTFTPVVIPISKTGGVSNYGIGGGNQVNSPLTGGLFDQYEGGNPATGLQYILQEQDPFRPIVNKLANPLVAGVAYNYAFDLGNRGTGSANKYIVMLYNADTQMPEKVIVSGVLNTLPAYNASPSYANFSGSFTPNSSANYYILFYPSVSGGGNDDFVIDRVAVAGAGIEACDTDGDDIPNYLDLDSDNDGCSDALEGGATNILTSNYKFTGAVGANGLDNTLETSDNGIVNYISTYNAYAINSAIKTCTDTDGDGVLDINDIDDDNDGVLDATESPTCFYTEAEAKVITSITTDLTIYSGNIGNSYDNNTSSYTQFTSGQDWVDKSIVEITPAIPLAIASVDFASTLNPLSNGAASTFKLQGYNGAAWEDLSAATSYTATGAAVSFSNSIHPEKAYPKYRLVGVAGTAGFAGITEITLTPYQYSASQHPKPNCTNDTDGDTKYNHQDLDSDGDGCSDSVEAGNTIFTSNNITVFNTGTDTNNNGLLDQFESATTPGTINYTSTYGSYATNATVNACLDSDGDGILDIIDIDDDNDGVLDTVEMVAVCNIVAATPTSVTVTPATAWGPIAATINNSGMIGSDLAATTDGLLQRQMPGMVQIT